MSIAMRLQSRLELRLNLRRQFARHQENVRGGNAGARRWFAAMLAKGYRVGSDALGRVQVNHFR